MEDREKEAIREALEASEGNRQSAAEKLGIGVATLYRKLKKYRLS
jgi:transcriptional regulator with PAS, ATPase and Fis domain